MTYSPMHITDFPDWHGIELAYCAGRQSVRQIAIEHGISHTAINKRAKTHKWSRVTTPVNAVSSSGMPTDPISRAEHVDSTTQVMIPVVTPQVSTVETNTSNPKTVTRGRRSAYTNELGEAICSAIADGVSLRAVLARPGMPSKSMVMRWLADERYVEFRDQYACAREDLADKLADEILQIADDGSNDTFLDANGNVKVNHDVIARARLQIDARKWLAAKLAPKKYGDGGQRENSGVNYGSMQVKSTVTFVHPPNWDENGEVYKDD
ncbi:hypothetical protein ACET9B_03000 [Aeromonas veronii]|nr:hypothetical protein [Aeromonas sp. FDAARGOS 1405]